MSNPIDEIEGVHSKGRKSSSWASWAIDPLYANEGWAQPPTVTQSRVGAVDTVSSAQSNPISSVQSSGSTVGEIVNLGKRMWELLCQPIVGNATTGTSSKPGGDGVQPVGSPTLETPFQIDKKQLEKLLIELKIMLEKIVASNNETEEDFIDTERKLLDVLVKQLKRQRLLHEEGSRGISTHLMFRTKKGEALGKEIASTSQLLVDNINNERYWGRINNGVTMVSVALTVAAVAYVIISTYGTGAPLAFSASYQAFLNISQVLTGFAHGGTQWIKGRLEKSVGEYKEKSEILKEAHSTNVIHVKQLMEQMQECFGHSLDIAKMMRQFAENDQQANIQVISRSPPVAPAA